MSVLARNLTLFRFPRALNATLESLHDRLASVPLKPVGALEFSTQGFVSPFGRGETELTHRVGDCILFALAGERKLLPAATINNALADKLDAIREREGRNPGGRERKRLKDEVLTDLLPVALAKPWRIDAWLDLETGWLVIDTSSRKAAESVVTAMREALGSFPALPINAETSPRMLLTGWITGDDIADGFLLGDECELRDPVDAGAVMRCKNQELDSDEIRENIKAGKQCFRLGLTFEDRIGFVLGEDLVIRRLRFLETATEALERDERDSLRAEIDATFALATGEIKRLLARLSDELSFSGRDA